MTSRGLKSRFGRMISLANTGEQIDKNASRDAKFSSARNDYHKHSIQDFCMQSLINFSK